MAGPAFGEIRWTACSGAAPLSGDCCIGIGGFGEVLGPQGIQPDVCHLTEGPAAFAVLERARSLMQETGQSYEVVLAVTRAGNLFTTLTTVTSGFDRFAPALVGQHLGRYAQEKLGITVHDLLAPDRQDADNGFVEDFWYGLSGHRWQAER